jgi:16S rRNA G527 N7-methylase RsmG
LDSEIIHDRIENLDAIHINKYKIITARAVSSLENLSRWTYPLLTEKGLLITVKGYDYYDELSQETNKKFQVFEYPVDKRWLNQANTLKGKMFLIMEKKSV